MGSGAAVQCFWERTLKSAAPIASDAAVNRDPVRQTDVYRIIGRRADCACVGRNENWLSHFPCPRHYRSLCNSAKLEIAQQMANHESARTTGLYDRSNDQVSLNELERILIRSAAIDAA